MAAEDDTRPLSVRETARRLGVHENTVRNWARDGVLRPIKLPGSRYQRFDPEEVGRLERQRRGQVESMQPTRRVSPDLVDASMLDSWPGHEPRWLFPRLIRSLAAASPGVRRVSVRAGEGTDLGGWDALIDGGRAGTAWLPNGPSAWELGTGGKPSEKAWRDFNSRTRNPLGVDPTHTTFVFATPRRWPQARDFEIRARALGIWRDVRTIEADDLEGWLEATPAVHVWLSEQLGLRPRDAITLPEWWSRFSARTKPAIPAGLLLAGRNSAAEQLRDLLREPPQAIGIQASSRDEAIAFVACAIPEDSDGLFPPSVVVSSDVAGDRLAHADSPVILIADDEHVDVPGALRSGKHVIVPLGPQDVPTGQAVMTLSRPDRSEGREAFAEAGVSSERADQLAALARRSLSSLLRELAIDPRSVRPPWGTPPHSAELASLMLIGSWGPSDDDQRIVAQVVGKPWSEIERELVGWATSDDPPFIRTGNEWRLASPQDAFAILEHSLTMQDVRRWVTAAQEVLGEINPALDLPTDERPFAGLQGKVPLFSSTLRSGVAQGLALLGVFGSRALGDGRTGRDLVRVAVRDLLAGANAETEGFLWASLSPELSWLAEAAPSEFLEAVDAGLAGSTPVLATVFQDAKENSWLTSSSPHTGLLWALETLCWSPDYLDDASLALARLAEVDPGGGLSNRPQHSLSTVFLPWHPYTSASVERRLDALAAIRRHHPTIAETLLLDLLPSSHQISTGTSKPTFRDWVPDNETTTVGEWARMVAGILDLLLQDAGSDARLTAELLDHAADLPPDQRELVLAHVEELSQTPLSVEDRLLLWGKITDVVLHHRTYADASWSMDAGDLKRLEAAAASIEPRQSVERYVRLFDWHPDLPDVRVDDYEAYDQALRRARADAVREALDTGGMEALVRLAADAKVPSAVGGVAGEVAGDGLASELLPLLSSDEIAGTIARGWLRYMAWSHGEQWITGRLPDLAQLSVEGQTAFLLELPAQPSTWQIVDRCSPEVQDRFWSAVPAWASTHDIDDLAARLLSHNRPWAVIDLLAMHVVSSRRVVQPDVDLVEQSLRRAVTADPKRDAVTNMSGYEVGALLDYLERSGCRQATIVELEWAYFPMLERHHRPNALFNWLAEDPRHFVELVSRVYRGEGERRRKLNEDQQAQTRHAWAVLDGWKTPPGSRDDGTIDREILMRWVLRARTLLAEVNRGDIGDQQIGQLLAGSLPGADGIWPAEAVRDVIETVGSPHLETGLSTGRYNARGVTSRGVYEGGTQERELVQRYRTWARAIKSRWRRTARVLERLADSYEWDARRHDEDAERDASAG